MTENLPDRETLLNQLQIEWQDHIQTRSQTWKTLQIGAFLLLCLVGADLLLENKWWTLLFGIIIITSNIEGIRISAHHRRAQIRKFKHIDRLEYALGLHRAGLLDEVHPPAEFKWKDALNPKMINTPLFILRMHIAISSCSFIYLIAKFVN